MREGTPADYVAAAVVYALYGGEIALTSDVRSDFIGLLKSRYGVEVPREVIVPALRLLAKQHVIILDDDRYLPLVTIPANFEKRVAEWRFIDKRTPANRILNRFMDGPADWMRRVLVSEEFLSELRISYSSDDTTKSITKLSEVMPGIKLDLSIDERLNAPGDLADQLASSAQGAQQRTAPNWTMWGTIFGALSLLATIIVAVIS